MQEYRLNIVLHGRQLEVHRNQARYKVIKAGKRFGKTKWAIFTICQQALRRPGEVFWYCCPTYRMAKNIAWHELSWLIPPQLIKRKIETDLFIEFINGSKLHLIGAENEDALRGPKLGGVILDEAAYIDEYVWSGIISGQLLGPQKNEFAYFISSPNKRGRNWFTNFHSQAMARMNAGDPEWAAFYFTIYDNPTIPKEEIDKLKDNTPDDTWNLEYMGIESEFAGQIFSEFNYSSHVGEQKTENPVLIRSLDWGIAHPTVCLWINVDEKNKMVYVEDEFVKTGNSIEESCRTINSKTGTREVQWNVIDPSTAKRNSQTKRSDMDEFGRYGIGCVPGDNKDRGYDITKMFFKKNFIKIHPRCKNLILQLKNLQWGDKENDDCTDCLRYACVRIHDFMFGGKLFDEPAKKPTEYTPEYLQKRREVSFNNPWIFPEVKQETQSWILQEIAD